MEDFAQIRSCSLGSDGTTLLVASWERNNNMEFKLELNEDLSFKAMHKLYNLRRYGQFALVFHQERLFLIKDIEVLEVSPTQFEKIRSVKIPRDDKILFPGMGKYRVDKNRKVIFSNSTSSDGTYIYCLSFEYNERET